MSVDGISAKSIAPAFRVATDAQSPTEQLLVAVPGTMPRRPSSKRIHRALAPAHHAMMTLSAAQLAAMGPALVLCGKVAAFAGRRKTLDGDTLDGDDDEQLDEHEAREVAHDAPEHLTHLAAQLGRLSLDDLHVMGQLSERTMEHGYGFVIEPTELPTKAGAQPGSRTRLAPIDVARALATHGRIYVGELSSVPIPGSNQVSWVVDAKSAEAIQSYEGLRSYLNLFR